MSRGGNAMSRALSFVLACCLLGCAGTETGNPPASPIVDPLPGGEPDLALTKFDVMTDVVVRGYSFSLLFPKAAFADQVDDIIATPLDPNARSERKPFSDGEVRFDFTEALPVVVRVQALVADGVYEPTDIAVTSDGKLSVHDPQPSCLVIERTDLAFAPVDAEPVTVVVRNDCAQPMSLVATALDDAPPVEVVSAEPLLVEVGGSEPLLIEPVAAPPADVVLMLDTGEGIEQVRALSVRLIQKDTADD